MLSSKLPIGLDITPTAVIAVAMKRKGKVYELESVATESLPDRTVIDGEVRDVPQLATAIRTLFKDNNIKNKQVAIGLANQRCVTRIIELPKMKKNELDQAISFEAQDLLPIALEDAIWDYQVIGEFKDEHDAKKLRIILVMTYRESVEKFTEAIEEAGLRPVRADLGAFALMRAALDPVDSKQSKKTAELPDRTGDDDDADSKDDGSAATVICNIGPTSTNIVVARDGVCDMTRMVAAGTQMFTQSLHEHFGWDWADCARVRMEAGIQAPGGIDSADDPYGPAREVMQQAADQLAQEIRTSIDYYKHQQQHPVAKVILAGEGALYRGVEQRFANELGMPVTVLDASRRVDIASLEQHAGRNHAHLALAMGLVIEEAAA